MNTSHLRLASLIAALNGFGDKVSFEEFRKRSKEENKEVLEKLQRVGLGTGKCRGCRKTISKNKEHCLSCKEIAEL